MREVYEDLSNQDLEEMMQNEDEDRDGRLNCEG